MEGEIETERKMKKSQRKKKHKNAQRECGNGTEIE